MRGLRSRTSVAIEDIIVDLKVMKNLAKRLWHRTSGTSMYSHTYGNHDDSWNPISSRDAEVEALEEGSENSAIQRCVTVVILISYAAIREATWERERQGVADKRRPAHLGCGRRRSWRRARGIMLCSPLLMGPLLYSGEGVHLTPSSRHLGRRPIEKGLAARETLTLAGLG
jgi:hypothetical protein